MSDSNSTKLILEALQKPSEPVRGVRSVKPLDTVSAMPDMLSEPSPELAELLANILGPDFKKNLNPAEG